MNPFHQMQTKLTLKGVYERCGGLVIVMEIPFEGCFQIFLVLASSHNDTGRYSYMYILLSLSLYSFSPYVIHSLMYSFLGYVNTRMVKQRKMLL